MDRKDIPPYNQDVPRRRIREHNPELQETTQQQFSSRQSFGYQRDAGTSQQQTYSRATYSRDTFSRDNASGDTVSRDSRSRDNYSRNNYSRDNRSRDNYSRDNSLERRRRQQARLKRRRKKKILRAVVLAGLLAALIIIILILKAFFGFVASLFSKDDKAEEAATTPKATTASILSTGDIIMHSPIFLSDNYHIDDSSDTTTEDDTIAEGDTDTADTTDTTDTADAADTESAEYNFDPIFEYIKEDYEAADFTVVNFESTISDGVYSGHPLFKAPEEILSSIKTAGADLCLLANNHIYDNGDEGLTMTMDAMDNNSLLYTGIQKSEEDKNYFIQEINDIKVGILNYTFETGTSTETTYINDLQVSSESVSLINSFNYDHLDPFYEDVTTSLQEMKDAGVEYTIAYIHWGTEYDLNVNDHQTKIAQQLCDYGINALIGGHPHVVQPVDLLTSTEGEHQMLCVYSVGNHLSNQSRDEITSRPEGHTEDGLMVNLKIRKSAKGNVFLKDVEFIPTWVYKNGEENSFEYLILPLDAPEEIIEKLSDLEIEDSVNESLERTNDIICEGVETVQAALPLSAK